LLFVLFDLVNAKLFSHYYKKNTPGFSVLFLNSIAHLQHHKWTTEDELSDEMKIAFTIFDKVIGTIFNNISPNEDLLITNAFTQHRSYDKKEYLYRQTNPEKFLSIAGIKYTRVEQAMTNDGHVFFEDSKGAKIASEILELATVNNKPAFHVDYNPDTPDKLFFQVIVWEELERKVTININGKHLIFFDSFEMLTRRSGSHSVNGHIFTNNLTFPETIYNHEIYNYIYRRLIPETLAKKVMP
jgi:hypothetical protein